MDWAEVEREKGHGTTELELPVSAVSAPRAPPGAQRR